VAIGVQEMIKRKWRYTTKDMSMVMNRSVHTIRDDKASGEFDPADFVSMIEYMLRKGINLEVKSE